MEPDDGAKKEFKFSKIFLFPLLKLQITVKNIRISKIIPGCLKADLKKDIFNHSTFFITDHSGKGSAALLAKVGPQKQ